MPTIVIAAEASVAPAASFKAAASVEAATPMEPIPSVETAAAMEASASTAVALGGRNTGRQKHAHQAQGGSDAQFHLVLFSYLS